MTSHRVNRSPLNLEALGNFYFIFPLWVWEKLFLPIQTDRLETEPKIYLFFLFSPKMPFIQAPFNLLHLPSAAFLFTLPHLSNFALAHQYWPFKPTPTRIIHLVLHTLPSLCHWANKMSFLGFGLEWSQYSEGITANGHCEIQLSRESY